MLSEENKMAVSVFLIGSATTAILLQLILFHIIKSNDKEYHKNVEKEHIVIRVPKAYLWVGGLCTLVFAFFMFLMARFPNGTEALWVWILFSLFFLLGTYLILNALVWRIDVFRTENYFLYRILPYWTRRVEYSDCISFKVNSQMNMLVLRTKKGTLHIDTLTVNFDFLLEMLKKHKVQEVYPKRSKGRFKKEFRKKWKAYCKRRREIRRNRNMERKRKREARQRKNHR